MTNWITAWDLEEGAERVTNQFRDRFGETPAGVYSAPGRVNIIGEHVDYNGGLCLPMAIDHRTFVALSPRPDEVITVASAQEDVGWLGYLSDVAPGTVSGWAGYAVGVAWALREAGYDVHGFTAMVDSCVPYGAGLSSSAALECAIAIGLDSAFNLGLGATDAGRTLLAKACVRAENQIAGAATGGMDQAISLRAVPGHVLALDCLDSTVEPVPFPLGELALLVIDTRAPHQLADGQYAARREVTQRAAHRLGYDTLRQAKWEDLARLSDDEVPYVRHVVSEIERVTQAIELLRAGRLADLGPILTAGHASLRDDYRVTIDELDLAAASAQEAGACGARMVGGGFGGSVIALVPAQRAASIADAVTAAFAERGFTAPAFLLAHAGGAAA